MARLDRSSRVLARIVRRRAVVLAIYAVLVPVTVLLAARIHTEVGIERLLVPSDPEYVATRTFHAVFPESQVVLLAFESNDPWSPRELARVDRAKAELGRIPHVAAFSVLDAIRRARPDADPAMLRQLATGTAFFRHQGLVGDDFLTLVVDLEVHDPAARDLALAAIDRALARSDAGAVRRVGGPYINAWLEHGASHATSRAFVFFGVLFVAITLFMYRSLRTLLAILIALGAAVLFALAAGSLLGFSFTIVSGLVPLTVMVTTLATLTYLQSRFIDQPDGVSLADHHVAALRNKLLPVTASMVAAAAGFAALAVSRIRPIQQMGIWTAVGLLLAWVVAFTLFPALQRVLRTPTGERARLRTTVYKRVAGAVPGASYRHRKPLVVGALAICIAGVLALTGIPGVFGSMPIQVDGLANIDPASAVARDLRWFRSHVMSLDTVHVWIHMPHATATEPETLRAVDQLTSAFEATTGVTGVTGPTTSLRMRSYLAGHGEALPTDPEQFATAAGDVEQLLLTEPDLRAFINPDTLSDIQLVVMFRGDGTRRYTTIARRIEAAWDATRASSRALAGARMNVVGEGLLDAKVGANLVPTLAESFVLTAVIILLVFLLIFRSAIERLLAMIPSVFALLATFLGLRVLGGSLNVATIIIATTVLGTTENDQMHFFHHMHERAGAVLAVRLRHTLRIAGRAVVLATAINAFGFLGLAVSSFPPLRQFGIMTASAFVLALVADFTVLPAALWIAHGRRRDDHSDLAGDVAPEAR